ncbi:unnamed protein product, partial [Polarella glacialis]
MVADIHELQDSSAPSNLFNSYPFAKLLAAFEAGFNGAVVVCGPQRVQSLVGTAGAPGLLALALARYAELPVVPQDPLGIYGLSAFFVLPEPTDTRSDGSSQTPVLDILEGVQHGRAHAKGSGRESWEQCSLETFSDVHKVLSLLARLLAAVTDPDGQAAAGLPVEEADLPSQKMQWQKAGKCLGRYPLVFRISLLAPCAEDVLPACSPRGGLTSRCRSLYMVEAPPAVSGGPVPSTRFLDLHPLS